MCGVHVCVVFACPDTTKSKKGKLYPAGSIEVESTDGAAHEGTVDGTKPEELNKKALQIIQRVRDKLTGRMRLRGGGGGEGRGGEGRRRERSRPVLSLSHELRFTFCRE